MDLFLLENVAYFFRTYFGSSLKLVDFVTNIYDTFEQKNILYRLEDMKRKFSSIKNFMANIFIFLLGQYVFGLITRWHHEPKKSQKYRTVITSSVDVRYPADTAFFCEVAALL